MVAKQSECYSITFVETAVEKTKAELGVFSAFGVLSRNSSCQLDRSEVELKQSL